jgi:hypothetical protein
MKEFHLSDNDADRIGREVATEVSSCGWADDKRLRTVKGLVAERVLLEHLRTLPGEAYAASESQNKSGYDIVYNDVAVDCKNSERPHGTSDYDWATFGPAKYTIIGYTGDWGWADVMRIHGRFNHLVPSVACFVDTGRSFSVDGSNVKYRDTAIISGFIYSPLVPLISAPSVKFKGLSYITKNTGTPFDAGLMSDDPRRAFVVGQNAYHMLHNNACRMQAGHDARWYHIASGMTEDVPKECLQLLMMVQAMRESRTDKELNACFAEAPKLHI